MPLSTATALQRMMGSFASIEEHVQQGQPAGTMAGWLDVSGGCIHSDGELWRSTCVPDHTVRPSPLHVSYFFAPDRIHYPPSFLLPSGCVRYGVGEGGMGGGTA